MLQVSCPGSRSWNDFICWCKAWGLACYSSHQSKACFVHGALSGTCW